MPFAPIYQKQGYCLCEHFPFQITQNNLEREMLTETVSLLLIYWSERHWSLIWNLFQNQPELAEAVLGNIAGSVMNEVRFMNNLSESHLGDIYSSHSLQYYQGL